MNIMYCGVTLKDLSKEGAPTFCEIAFQIYKYTPCLQTIVHK